MASLTELSRELDEHSTLTRQLLSAFEDLTDERTDVSTKKRVLPVAPTDIAQELVALDGRLQRAADRIEEHQKWQRKLEAVDDDIDRCETAMASLARHIYDAQGEVIRILEDAEKSTDSSETRPVDMDDLLEYGRRLANFTSAPPGYDPQAPTAAGTIVRPPFPSEQQMKSGWMRGTLDGVEESMDGEKDQDGMDGEDGEGEGVEGESGTGHGHGGGGDDDDEVDPFDLDLNPDME
ncbi:vitamin-D-receptor interacting mediator subunit 4-domain-containing protein [Piptocephalis cylindrospora]|uniref:Mediator of RNA polymerase II transcription subunit 4 n=1 Tax=Piptocephalis cylindrospora TaxID=1907219 RepID=A0A4P9XYX2_9FUNG|nr:vitamin-D-receptor interacting mediator subunit 4-domain-containing protein [Piptocephalis cylindrospora]|eukprot:RKP11607.1 vitamin-D-receptor interacting mediator subunit 4-domain-containing protein [Piptocephalis cylindrospora]